jgi:hypothetical protein
METLKIKRGPRRPNRRRKEKRIMKNITRTIRTLTVEYPVKAENGFETRTSVVTDMGAAAVRAELKKRSVEANVKFLGEYDVVKVDEQTYSMSVETFVEHAKVIG